MHILLHFLLRNVLLNPWQESKPLPSDRQWSFKIISSHTTKQAVHFQITTGWYRGVNDSGGNGFCLHSLSIVCAFSTSSIVPCLLSYYFPANFWGTQPPPLPPVKYGSDVGWFFLKLLFAWTLVHLTLFLSSFKRAAEWRESEWGWDYKIGSDSFVAILIFLSMQCRQNIVDYWMQIPLCLRGARR